jgi:hypothetical protein
MPTLDFIADIHGRFSKLCLLMERLGYRRDEEAFLPPSGHRAVFLGDLIDPKPGHEEPGGVRATLQAVKTMVDRGDAEIILGNHELNALCYHTQDGKGDWLRAHTAKNIHQHEGTLADFPDHENQDSEWRTLWMPWMESLPLWLDLGNVRAIHACWRDEDITLLSGRLLSEPDLLRASAHADRTGDPEGLAVERLLKGIEAPLPAGESFLDQSGAERTDFRVRWWAKADPGITCADLLFPTKSDFTTVPASPAALDLIPGYSADAPPLFIGHYSKPANSPLSPEAPNLACLDHGASKDGPLVAYRWQGEDILTSENYITHDGKHTA